MTAVDGVDLDVPAGRAMGLVGESGCGKTTLGRSIVGQLVPERGEVTVGGTVMGDRRSREDQRRVQMVFQDPMSSLNPKMRIGTMLAELLTVHQMVPREAVATRVAELLRSVGLPTSVKDRFPDLLSGGQRQRVSIARALALAPEVLVADEITSALDVSIQAQVLTLLLALRAEFGLTVLFISHNLAVVRQICDEVAVMYLGRIVERGPTEELFARPAHPYTRLLLSSVPRLSEVNLSREWVSSREPEPGGRQPGGCRFRDRCPLAQDICITDDPALRVIGAGHAAACHFATTDQPVGTDDAPATPAPIERTTT